MGSPAGREGPAEAGGEGGRATKPSEERRAVACGVRFTEREAEPERCQAAGLRLNKYLQRKELFPVAGEAARHGGTAFSVVEKRPRC